MSDTVESRLTERIKAQLPDLLEDKDLQELVKRSIDSVFFAKRKRKVGYKEEEVPPLIHELTMLLLKQTVTDCIDRWLTDNKALVAEQMAKALQAGIGGCVLESLSNRFQDELWKLQNALAEKGLYQR